MSLVELHAVLCEKLAAIARVLPVEYKLTLVARHRTLLDGDIIIGDDSLDNAITAIQKLKDRPDRIVK